MNSMRFAMLAAVVSLAVFITSCGRTVSNELPTDIPLQVEPTGTPTPAIQAGASPAIGEPEEPGNLQEEVEDKLKTKIFQLAGVTSELDAEGFLIFRILTSDDYGNALHFSGLPDDYPIPLIGVTATTLYLFAADETLEDAVLAGKLGGLSLNTMKTYITHDEDRICVISQAPWRETLVSSTYRWNGKDFIAVSDEARAYYERMMRYVEEENMDALMKEYGRDSTPKYCAAYQGYYELPAMVLRLADKKAQGMYRDKKKAVETMEYGMECYESVWRWTTDGEWREGLKSITIDQIRSDSDFHLAMRLPADEFIRILKNYADLLCDAGQDTDLEALLFKITELNRSMNQSHAERLDKHGRFFNVSDYGFESINQSSFYWSPENGTIVFSGNRRNEAGVATTGVYILNPYSKELWTVLEDMADSLYMLSPGWSERGDAVVFSLFNPTKKEQPIYYYDIDGKKTEKLPVSGWYPSISPDAGKVALSNADGGIIVYNLSDGNATTLPENIKGFHPIWLSDNRRILFFKSTGKNPEGLEGGELHDICVVDTEAPDSAESLGYEKVFRSMDWIVQDHLAAVYSGWDDGHYFELLNLDTGKLTEMGEGERYRYQKGEETCIVQMVDGGFRVLDTDLKETGDLFPTNDNANNRFLALDSNGCAAYLSRDPATGRAAIMLSDRHNQTIRQMTAYDEYVNPMVSEDGDRITLFSRDGKSFVFFNTYDVTHRHKSADTMISHIEGAESIRKAVAASAGSGDGIEARYDGLIRKSFYYYYQYTVNQGSDAALNLLVDILSGEIRDADYKSGDYPIMPVSDELRDITAEAVKQSSDYYISPDNSMMVLLEDYRFSKTLKAAVFRDEGMKDGLMVQLTLNADSGAWKLADEGLIPLDGTRQESSGREKNPNKVLIINHNEDLNRPIDPEPAGFDADELAATIEVNGIYPARSGIQYDFNGDNQPDTLTCKNTSHSNSRLSQLCEEFELQLGEGFIYYQLFHDPYSEYMSNFSQAGICDMDKSDKYIEIFVTTETYNGVRWNTDIYRLNEKNEIIRLVSLPSCISGISGDGKIYYWGGNLIEKHPFNPDYVVSYYDINLQGIVETDQIIGKTFTDIRAIIYKDREDVPVGPPVEASLDFPGAIRNIKENEAVTILEVGGDTAKIRTEDGLEGWIGGFHMVWD